MKNIIRLIQKLARDKMFLFYFSICVLAFIYIVIVYKARSNIIAQNPFIFKVLPLIVVASYLMVLIFRRNLFGMNTRGMYERRSDFADTFLLWLLCFVVFVIIAGVFWFSHAQKKAAQNNDGKIKITLLQINDVYEISPLDSGRSGGLARVATLKRQLLKENPNTFMILAGDFVSPSAIGTLPYGDSKIAGKQMVDVLNATGLDLATFGNHEFDLNQKDLQKCIDTSKFDWVSSNIKPLYSSGNLVKNYHGSKNNMPETYTRDFTDNDGTHITIGFIGLTIETSAGKDYIEYEDYIAAAKRSMHALEGRCDFVIAITHLSIDEDKKLAKECPTLKMIIGGHEHVTSSDTIGNVYIYKADANVKTAFEHFLEYDKNTQKFTVHSHLQKIDDEIGHDPAVKITVDRWNYKATKLLEKKIKDTNNNPCQIIASLSKTFDGTEKSIRSKKTELTLAIARGISAAFPSKPFAVYNSGGIRLDDSLKRDITYYDLFRVLPYPSIIRVDTIPGSALNRLLDLGNANPGDGSFLQYDSTIAFKNPHTGKWKINGNDIADAGMYPVAINDYLGDGKQDKMEFLKTEDKNHGKDERDMLAAVVAYFRKAYGKNKSTSQHIIPCY